MLPWARRVLNLLRVRNPLLRQEPCAPLLSRRFDSLGTLDYTQSVSNFAADEHGNYLLDLDSSASALGYNHADLLYSALDPRLYTSLAQQPQIATTPDKDLADLIRSSLMPVAPKGLHDVVLSSSAVKSAVVAAVRKYRAENPSAQNCMGVISFSRTGGSGRIAFPDVKFPYVTHETANLREEQRALRETESALKSQQFAGVLVEPITKNAGLAASPTFYIALQELCNKHNAAFIVDETQTGLCATGLFWAHEHWGPRACPDLVLFGGRAHASGYFTSRSFRPYNPASDCSTSALQMLAATRKVIHSQRLQKNAEFIGQYLRSQLQGIEGVGNTRGAGLFLAFDCESEETAEAVADGLLKVGVIVPHCGRTLSLRPSLTFQKKHADLFLQRLRLVLERIGAGEKVAVAA